MSQARSNVFKLRDVVNAKDPLFGAKGDGVTDDTVALQAAINQAELTAGTVYLPNGTYKVTARLLLKRASLLGQSELGTTIMGIGAAPGIYLVDYDTLAADVVEHITIENLTIRSDNQLPNGVRLKNVSYVVMRDIRLHRLNHGIVLEGTRCFTQRFTNVTGYDIFQITVMFNAGFTGGGQFTFDGCTFTGDTGVTVSSTGGVDNLNFTGCNFEQCVTNSMYIGGLCAGLSVVGCRTEGCNGNDFVLRPELLAEYVAGINISGNTFSASDNAGAARIVMGGLAGPVRAFNISGNVVTHGADGYNTAMIQFNGTGESGLVAGNMVRGVNPNAQVVNAQRAGVIVFGNENLSGKLAEWWGTVPFKFPYSDAGVWVPVDTSGAGLVFAGAAGNWIRNGNQVFYQALVVYPATANGAAAQIGGLPFPISGGTQGRSGGHVDLTDAGIAIGILQLAPTDLNLRNPTNFAVNITNAQLTGKSLYLSGHYTI